MRMFFYLATGLVMAATPPVSARAAGENILYTYTLTQNGTAASYDEAMAAATLQGVINRDAPELYVLSDTNSRPRYWLDLLSKNGRWLEGRKVKALPDLTALVELADKRLKGAIIWDPGVPASVNVATTLAGVDDAVVLSPEFAERYLPKWRLPVLQDLRGKFTGEETGSKKNDAYRWAIRECLEKCSPHRLCLYEDAFSTRARGKAEYVVTRDWAVKSRAFVFDLSPWGDEAPGDDPGQRIGLDLETYKMILGGTLHHAAGKEMTEITGFFAYSKYSHRPDHESLHEEVPTEWATIWLISPYNVYQNTISSDCFNESLHSQAPRRPLRQHYTTRTLPLENKAYIAVLMADYDSATPLYESLPKFWHDADRGKLPLTWGIDPSLLETYPDIISYFYSTATPDDIFAADASAAGYMNPNRVHQEFLPLFLRHNAKFFREADMTMAPMVLDQDQPSADVKDAFAQFAPDGYATIVSDMLGNHGHLPAPQVWKGMPVMELINDACNSHDPESIADAMVRAIGARGNPHPAFYLFRVIWSKPSAVAGGIDLLRKQHPEINCEFVSSRELFALYKEHLEGGHIGAR
jgi:hypothetical protein